MSTSKHRIRLNHLYACEYLSENGVIHTTSNSEVPHHDGLRKCIATAASGVHDIPCVQRRKKSRDRNRMCTKLKKAMEDSSDGIRR